MLKRSSHLKFQGLIAGSRIVRFARESIHMLRAKSSHLQVVHAERTDSMRVRMQQAVFFALPIVAEGGRTSMSGRVAL